MREGDCLARLGGDEFAVVAPGAGGSGVARIVCALEEAIAWGVAPHDAATADGLLRFVDERLLGRKRLAKSAI